MDTNTVAFTTLCFCFFFILPLGVGFYFFIVKKKDTSEEETSAMTSQTRFPFVPLAPIVSPLLKKTETVDIPEENHLKD